MKQFNDAKALVKHSQTRIETLRLLHVECLAEKTVKDEFLFEVKGFIENLRSVLDYCARGLFAKYGHSKRNNPNIYFPYSRPGIDHFQSRVQYGIPGLLEHRPDIVNILESYQYFGSTGNWLYLFMLLTNENKHVQLTPLIERKFKETTIDVVVPLGTHNLADLLKTGTSATVTWTGLVFAETGIPVILHLEHVLETVDRIVNELSTV